MANPKTRTVEFSIESFVFLFNFVQKLIKESTEYIDDYFGRLEMVASNPNEDFIIYNHEKKEFEESKNNIINFSPIYEMLLGVYDGNSSKKYYDYGKEYDFMLKLSLMAGAKKLVDILKEQGIEIKGV